VQSLALVRDLIGLRRNDPVFGGLQRIRVDGAILAATMFVIRFFGNASDDRLLCVNLGADFTRASIAEPLLAPPEGMRWHPLWCSEAQEYGGDGVQEFDATVWRFAAHSATVLGLQPAPEVAEDADE